MVQADEELSVNFGGWHVMTLGIDGTLPHISTRRDYRGRRQGYKISVNDILEQEQRWVCLVLDPDVVVDGVSSRVQTSVNMVSNRAGAKPGIHMLPLDFPGASWECRTSSTRSSARGKWTRREGILGMADIFLLTSIVCVWEIES